MTAAKHLDQDRNRATDGGRKRAPIARFAKNESGALSIFSIFMFMLILIVGGIGVDLMNNEVRRVRLQATLDRAVLAAADIDQQLAPEEVVRDYFAEAGMSGYLLSTTVNEGENFRSVSATAKTPTRPLFLHLLGVNEMSAPASGTAEERVNKLEISMVLDVSGSMRDNQKMANLKLASKQFIDLVLNEKSKDLVTISLVPYHEHVNPGPAIFGRMNVLQKHGYSYCIEIPDADMSTATINPAAAHTQMQHYQWNYYGTYGDVRQPVCTADSWAQITPLSDNATALKNQIDQFAPQAGTSIFLGMKWGTALLDPTFRNVRAGGSHPASAFPTVVGPLAAVPSMNIDAKYSGRPYNYGEADNIKTVVLMTDGQNDRSNRIADWAYDSPSEVAVWKQYNLWHFLYNYVQVTEQASFYYNKYTAETGDSLLDNICDAAKARGIIVWAVGVEVTDHGAAQMQNCASSPSHFFRVEGVQIADAFAAIAQQISQLRLTN